MVVVVGVIEGVAKGINKNRTETCTNAKCPITGIGEGETDLITLKGD
jgi:hypothetical protein